MSNKVKVWDVPTRLFHWTLLAMFAGMWASAENGQLQIHTKLGVAMLVLVVFRLLWGVVGSQTARFSDFFKPCQVKAYLRGEVSENQQPGHNPLGGLMVVALLGALLVQLGLGLFAADVDSYTFDGPLAKLIDSGLAEQVTDGRRGQTAALCAGLAGAGGAGGGCRTGSRRFVAGVTGVA